MRLRPWLCVLFEGLPRGVVPLYDNDDEDEWGWDMARKELEWTPVALTDNILVDEMATAYYGDVEWSAAATGLTFGF